jgi:hypothetical protein
LRSNRTILVFFLFLVLFLQTHANGQGISPISQWTVGSSWSVRAVYRQVSGEWSDPVLWSFTVESEEEGALRVRVKGQGSGEALLGFDKEAGQLKQIWLTDVLRGKEVRREIRIETLSPVYPLFSVAPYHFPCFSYSAYEDEYRLSRSLNGRPVGLETLYQTVDPAPWEQWISEMPTEAKKDWEEVSFVSDGRLFSVQKKGENIFRQYWFPDFPWAVYTETKDLKAWMVR